MDTRGKSNAEFRNEVNEILLRHESSFDQVNATLQAVLTELQALRTTRNLSSNSPEINPFANEESSRQQPTHSQPANHHQHHNLKLSFPKFGGDDPIGWIYKAEQYFEFQNIMPNQQVQLASFHLEGIALQWHRWLTKFRGPLTWEELTKAIQQRFGPTDYEDPSEALTRLKHNFLWSGMRGMVKDYLKECDVCQRFKNDCMKPSGLLQPLPIPTRIWTDISMDFIEGLPSSNGYSVIMVVVDRLTKYAHFVALKHPFSAATVAKAFITNVVRLHGIPTSIVSDRDKVFLSSFWQALFQLQGTQLCMSSSYHPQSDGQTEVMNRTLEQYLRCFTGDQPRKWVEWLSWAEYSYNTATHSSTKLTPFEAVYGTPPPTLLTYVPGTSRIQAVDECLRDRDAILKDLRHNLQLAQNRMKCQADQHRRDISFNVGDYVYLKLQPYRQTSVALRLSQKLSPRFFGPYQIIGKIGPVAYKLSLPVGSQIHNVFHVSLLRRYHGSGIQASPQLPLHSDASACLPEPEAILDRRTIRKGNYRPKSKILVKWKNAPVEDATWENEWRFSKSYPSFILVDKDS